MDFIDFMRKVDGKEPQHEPTNSQTPEAGTLDVQSILRIARGYGYQLHGMEERPEFPTGVVELFLGQQPGYPEVGLHEHDSSPWEYYQYLHSILESGRRYSQSQPQEELLTPSFLSHGLYYQGASSYRYTREQGWTYRSDPMGGATRDTQPRSESNLDELVRTIYETLTRDPNSELVRSPTGTEEVGVSGVRGEWEGSEHL